MNKEKVMNLEYELFLNGYTVKQIAGLVNTSVFKVQLNLKKMQRKINNDKLLVNKTLRVSFN